jgi:hypothetical protein
MTPRIIDTKKLGLNNLGSMEIQSIATNSTASWVYLGRSNSLDRHYLNLIACEMDTVTGEQIGEPIFLPDSTRKSDLGQIRIGKIIVDESKNLLYLCRSIYPGLADASEFEAITVYELDPSGRPMGIVKTCTTQFPGQKNNGDGVYNIAIYQNYLYAVGQGIAGVFIYELDKLGGIPTMANPIEFSQIGGYQQIEIISDKTYKIYLGTYQQNKPPALQVGKLTPNDKGIPIPTDIKSFDIEIGVTSVYLDFQISKKGIYPQNTELPKSKRPSTRPLYFLAFDTDGLPILPPQILTANIRGSGVNTNNELWFAKDDTYTDVIDGSSGTKGITLTKYESIIPPTSNPYSVKLRFPRLVCVAETGIAGNGIPVLLCDSYFVSSLEDFGNQNIISGWNIRFKLNQILYRKPTVIPPEGIEFSLEGYYLNLGNGNSSVIAMDNITLKPGDWSADISLDMFLKSIRQPMIFKLKLSGSSFVDPKLSRLEVAIEIHESLPGTGKIILPSETTDGDLVQFWLPGYGVQDLPDLKSGESTLEQRYSARLIEWASQRVQRHLTDLWRVAPTGAVQSKQYSVSAYGMIGWQPSRLQLHLTAEMLAYMGFNSSEITKYLWTGLNVSEINNAVGHYLPYRNFAVASPLYDGTPETTTQNLLHYFDFFLSEPTVKARLDEWVKNISNGLFENGVTSTNTSQITVANEPSWAINPVVTEIRASTYYLNKFHTFLKDKTDLTAQDFGAVVGESFEVLMPALVTLPTGTSLTNRRLYYWTVRFLVESASDGFGKIAELMRGSVVGINNPNLFTPIIKSGFGGLWAETGRWHGGISEIAGEPDWFDLGRKNVPAICAENWSGDNFGTNLSYTANLMRCAANLGSEKNFGAYIRGLRLIDPEIPTYAVMTYAGYGCKNFTFFNYGHGPHQIDSWSEYPALYPVIRNALDMLGQAENLLYPGRSPVAQVAVLHPGASDIWNEFSYTCLYQVEAHGIYQALRHAGYAVDLIDEIELKDKFFSNINYRVLYITGPNIPRSAIEPLKLWVEAGNTAIVTNGAAMRDEYHERLVDANGINLLDSLLGLADNSRSEDRTTNGLQDVERDPISRNQVDRSQYIKIDNPLYGGYAEFLLATPSHPLESYNDPIDGAEAKTIASSKINGNVFTTEYQLDPIKGRVNGTGKAITFGMYFGATYMLNYGTDSYQSIETRNTRPTNWNTVLRKLIVAPVEQLGIAKPVEIDQNLEIECCRLESMVGIGIVLLNWSGKKAENLTFKVINSGIFTNVKSVKQGILVANVVGANLEIELPSLETVDVLLIT